MPILKWNDSYSVGSKFIDGQHQALFKAVNDMYDAVNAGQPDRQQVTRCMKFLAEYTRTHFSDEENWLRENNYPCLEQHLAEHRQLIQQIEMFAQRIANGGLDKIAENDLIQFLVGGWLLDHIVASDSKYSLFIKDASPGNSD
jgi:hemerythrin-like metal-binding protein